MPVPINAEKTTDGQSKMVEAKRVVPELVTRLPESLRGTLIVYGFRMSRGRPSMAR
jgi:hypothetical protein